MYGRYQKFRQHRNSRFGVLGPRHPMVFATNRGVIVVEHDARLSEDSEIDVDQQLLVRVVDRRFVSCRHDQRVNARDARRIGALRRREIPMPIRQSVVHCRCDACRRSHRGTTARSRSPPVASRASDNVAPERDTHRRDARYGSDGPAQRTRQRVRQKCRAKVECPTAARLAARLAGVKQFIASGSSWRDTNRRPASESPTTPTRPETARSPHSRATADRRSRAASRDRTRR